MNCLTKPAPWLGFFAVIASVTVAAVPGSAATDPGYDWSGAVSTGARISITNHRGSVFLQRGDTSRVEVRAVAPSGAAAPDAFVTTRTNDGLSIAGNPSSTAAVDELVLVPQGVSVTVETDAGAIIVERIDGAVAATTTSGDIHAVLDALPNGPPLSVKTESGSIVIEAPKEAKLNVRADAPAGGVSSSFSAASASAPADARTLDLHTGRGTIAVRSSV